jgi:hypothetical protein
MISPEFDPFYVRGGIAFAIRRLADQLTGQGIETTVLLPDWVDTRNGQDFTPLLLPMRLKMGVKLHWTRAQRYGEFCRAAFETAVQIGTTSGSDATVAHSDESAMFIVLRNARQHFGPSVFWLHGLYDPPIDNFSKAQRRLLPSTSLLACAVKMADIVVTSSGILKDAQELEWPDRLKELQSELTNASVENRMLTVEAAGCLPVIPPDYETELSSSPNLVNLKRLPSRYVLFPCRPTVSKGFGIFAAIAERLRADNITCVALRPPAQAAKLESPSRGALVQWLPWLTQKELSAVMRKATCAIFPSITEGFGLTAAESISLGVPTLYQQVGGHQGLQALPNAVPVTLTLSERANLYHLWSELISVYPDSWSVWARHEAKLQPLIDRWVEAIRTLIRSADGATVSTESSRAEQGSMAGRNWGNQLRSRIESGREKHGQRTKDIGGNNIFN